MLVEEHRSGPEPILSDAVIWLREHVAAPADAMFVHCDCRTGNLTSDGDRIAAVLDWEFACSGDPAIDLAWVCAASTRMGPESACQLLPREDALRRDLLAAADHVVTRAGDDEDRLNRVRRALAADLSR